MKHSGSRAYTAVGAYTYIWELILIYGIRDNEEVNEITFIYI